MRTSNVKLNCVVITLRDLLEEWQDWDVAAHAVGVALGIFPATSQMSDFKAVFWSNNELGNALFNVLDKLCDEGFVERSPEETP